MYRSAAHSILAACVLAGSGILGASEQPSLSDALARGKLTLNARLRYEGVAQSGVEDADALTLRTRLGFTTAPINGWNAMLEVEDITAADGASYNQSGLNPGGARRAVVADPETTEVNQSWVGYTTGKTAATLGRQRLVLDNARFVGDVGWRQNQQTFDAFLLQDRSLKQTTLTYGHLWQINRVFGDKHPQGDFRSNSHVLHLSHAVGAVGTVAAYAYLLDFDNAAASSCATYGVSFAGGTPVADGVKVTYRVEYAVQEDHGSSQLVYSTDYVAAELGLAGKPGAFTVGREVLGSDRGVSFRTPLATLHAFNGWADLFVNTPGNGLRDTYVKAAVNLPAGFALVGAHHWFKADRLGANYGREIDAQLSRKFGPLFSGALKYAKFNRELATLPDVTKVWLQVEFAY
jgi:hypothetical protein